jgi:hypothetical protein
VQVVFDCLLAQEQARRDLAIGMARRGQPGDLALTGRQVADSSWRAPSCDLAAGPQFLRRAVGEEPGSEAVEGFHG